MRRRLPLVGLRARWEFQPRDWRIGLYGARRPHACDMDGCWNNEVHLWLCLLPTLPLHVRWLVRTERKSLYTKK